jgi:hypothetical protein
MYTIFFIASRLNENLNFSNYFQQKFLSVTFKSLPENSFPQEPLSYLFRIIVTFPNPKNLDINHSAKALSQITLNLPVSASLKKTPKHFTGLPFPKEAQKCILIYSP